MKLQRVLLSLLALSGATTSSAIACGSAGTGQPRAPSNQGATADDLGAFAHSGKVLATVVGDLNADGTADVLLVLDPPANGNEKLGQGRPRSVLLLTRDASGHLRTAGRNDSIVPCAKCGGVAGDPYSYSEIRKGQFTIVTEGGSREHWSNDYTFVYSPEHTDWLLHGVTREVSDSVTGKQKSIDLTSRDFGIVQFTHFDPATLPGIDLP